MGNRDKFIFNSVIECPHCGHIRTTEDTRMDILCNSCEFWQDKDTETFTYTCEKCGKEFNCDITLKTETTHFITVKNITKKG